MHILRGIWHHRIDGFWSIWIAMTVIAALGAAVLIRFSTTVFSQRQNGAATTPVRSDGRSRTVIASLILFALFLAAYVAMTVKWEDFADYDDTYFTAGTLQGHNLTPRIWPDIGRFFPLGHQEFNVIRHFTGTITGYHALPIAQLLIISWILLVLDDELSLTARIGLAASILVTPGLVTSFSGLVFPERNLLFWLVCVLLFVKLFEQKHATGWAVAAVISAQFMIYYKETACLLLLGFAVGRIVFRCWPTEQTGWSFARIRDKESRLDLCFIALSFSFLLYYFAAMMPHVNMQYASQQQYPLATVMLFYLRMDLLAWIFVGVVVGRAYLILRKRVLPSPYWDGLSWGAVLCFVAYIYLRLTTAYYLAPVDLIAVLYMGRLAILSWEKLRARTRTATAAIACAVLIQCILLSSFRMFERKNAIHAKAAIADVIVARYQRGEGNLKRLYFPFADVYPITEFASYLAYRGVPVEGSPVETAASAARVMIVAVVEKDGRCVSYGPIVCHPATGPKPGDLVIELPEDEDSTADLAPYQAGGESLLSYSPSPHWSPWFNPFVNTLRVASVRFEYKNLPPRWMKASVTAWK